MGYHDSHAGSPEPETSSGLLRSLATDPDSARWTEFLSLYTPLMRLWLADLAKKYPSLRPELFDDILQETFIFLTGEFPKFEYDPGKGHFRGYLREVLRIQARRAASRESERQNRVADIAEEALEQLPDTAGGPDGDDSSPELVQALWNILLDRVFAEGNFSRQSQTVFRKLVSGKATVAELSETYCMKPNAIYQLKSRVINAIKERKKALERECNSLIDYLEKMAGDEIL